MSPTGARSIFGKCERKLPKLDSNIRSVIIDSNAIIFLHYIKCMQELCSWDSTKAMHAVEDDQKFIDKVIIRSIAACLEMLIQCNVYFCTRGITVRFAFDGTQPTEKQPVLKRRRLQIKTSREILSNIKNLRYKRLLQVAELQLYLRNIPKAYPPNDTVYKYLQTKISQTCTTFIVDGECDKQCSLMARLGECDAILSPDWDLILFGCPVIIRFVPNSFELITIVKLEDILNSLDLTREEVCLVCILSGVDYNGDNKGHSDFLAIHESLQLVKQHNEAHTIHELKSIISNSKLKLKWIECQSVYNLA